MADSAGGSPSPGSLALPPGEVHVWAVAPVDDPSGPDEGVLSEEERVRAARFHRPADRARSRTARAALRRLLGGYSGVAPASLRFGAGRHGKPFLAPRPAGAPLFNVAHSGRLVLLAFAACEVGVDVEKVREGADVASLAERFFAREEADALAAAPSPLQAPLFFRIWTRKEAYLKATGSGLAGLSEGLGSFSTSTRSGAPVAAIRAPDGTEWFLEDLAPGDAYAGAIVTAVPARVVFRHFPMGK